MVAIVTWIVAYLTSASDTATTLPLSVTVLATVTGIPGIVYVVRYGYPVIPSYARLIEQLDAHMKREEYQQAIELARHIWETQKAPQRRANAAYTEALATQQVRPTDFHEPAERALTVLPNDDEGNARRYELLKLWADLAMSVGHYDEGLERLAQAGAVHRWRPRSAGRVLLERVDTLWYFGDRDLALDEIRQLTMRASQDWTASKARLEVLLAACEYELWAGNLEAARFNWSETQSLVHRLHLNANAPALQLRWANMLLNSGYTEPALVELRALAARADSVPVREGVPLPIDVFDQATVTLAQVTASHGRFYEANTAFEALIDRWSRLGPGPEAQAVTAYAQAMALSVYGPRALQRLLYICDEVEERWPGSLNVVVPTTVKLLFDANRKDEARARLERWMRAAGDGTEGQLNAAALLLQLKMTQGRATEGLARLEALLDSHPAQASMMSANAYRTMASAYARSDQHAQRDRCCDLAREAYRALPGTPAEQASRLWEVTQEQGEWMIADDLEAADAFVRAQLDLLPSTPMRRDLKRELHARWCGVLSDYGGAQTALETLEALDAGALKMPEHVRLAMETSRASALVALGRTDEALARLATLAERSPVRADHVRLTQWRGKLLAGAGRASEALAAYADAETFSVDPLARLNLVLDSVSAALAAGLLDEALEHGQRALNLTQTSGTPTHQEVNATLALAAAHAARGEHAAELKLLGRTLARVDDQPHLWSMQLALRLRYSEALMADEQPLTALRIAQAQPTEVPPVQDLVALTRARARLERHYGDSAVVEPLLRELIETLVERQEAEFTISALSLDLAEFLGSAGRHDEAEALLWRRIAVHHEDRDPIAQAELLLALADQKRRSGELEEAAATIAEALEHDVPLALRTRLRRGRVAVALAAGDPDAADAELETLLSELGQLEDAAPVRAQLAVERAMLSARRDGIDDAEELLDDALPTIDEALGRAHVDARGALLALFDIQRAAHNYHNAMRTGYQLLGREEAHGTPVSYARTLMLLAEVRAQQAEAEEAAALAAESEAHLNAHHVRPVAHIEALLQLGGLYHLLNDGVQVRRVLALARDKCVAHAGDQTLFALTVRQRRAELLVVHDPREALAEAHTLLPLVIAASGEGSLATGEVRAIIAAIERG